LLWNQNRSRKTGSNLTFHVLQDFYTEAALQPRYEICGDTYAVPSVERHGEFVQVRVSWAYPY
jgi:hypothetical protein